MPTHFRPLMHMHFHPSDRPAIHDPPTHPSIHTSTACMEMLLIGRLRALGFECPSTLPRPLTGSDELLGPFLSIPRLSPPLTCPFNPLRPEQVPKPFSLAQIPR